MFLLALLGLPLAASLLAARPAEASSLRGCCRRDGKHHCMAPMAETSQEPALRSTQDRCPYEPALPAVLHHEVFGSPATTASFAHRLTHDAAIAQTESMLRIARSRSRHKRGPPPVVPTDQV